MKKILYEPSAEAKKRAYVKTMEEYRAMHRESVENPEKFWSEIAKQFHWETPVHEGKFFSYNFDPRSGPVNINWMEGATTNICYNLLDRNVRLGHGDKIAFYWHS